VDDDLEEPTIAEGDFDRSPLSLSQYMQMNGMIGGVELDHPEREAANPTAIATASGDRYEVGEVVAKGGMGAILGARDLNCRRSVAMKVILPTADTGTDQVLRFIEEAQITAQLEHPNIVPVHELGIDTSESVFYTMKFVNGTSLEDILVGLKQGDRELRAKYPFTKLISIFLRACDAVAFANSKNVIHRDLKPANMMVGDFGEVLVLDWGLAKVIGRDDQETDLAVPLADLAIDSIRGDGYQESNRTMEGHILGTPAYMAPEQALGQISRIGQGTDVYGLGGILYKILTFESPVETGPVHAMLMRVVEGDLTPPATRVAGQTLPHLPGGLPASLSAVVAKAMALRMSDRYHSVQQLQADVEAWRNGFATVAEQAGFLRQLQLLTRRHKEKALATSAAAMVILALSTAFLLQLKNERNQAIASAQRAEVAEQEARKNEGQALELAQELRRAGYAATMTYAASFIDDGKLERANALLDEQPVELRGWEWGHLKQRCNLEFAHYPIPEWEHGEFSDDWTLYYGINEDDDLCIRHIESNTTRVVLSNIDREDFHRLTLSGDKQVLAWSNHQGQLTVYNLEDQQSKQWPLKDGKTFRLMLSQSGRYVTTFRDGVVMNTHTGNLVFERPDRLFTCVLTPAERLLYVDSKRRLILWDLASGKEQFSIPTVNRAHAIQPAAFSSDGALVSIYFAGNNPSLRIAVYELKTGKLRGQFACSDKPLTLCFNTAGDTLAAFYQTGVAELFSVSSGKKIAQVQTGGTNGRLIGDFVESRHGDRIKQWQIEAQYDAVAVIKSNDGGKHESRLDPIWCANGSGYLLTGASWVDVRRGTSQPLQVDGIVEYFNQSLGYLIVGGIRGSSQRTNIVDAQSGQPIYAFDEDVQVWSVSKNGNVVAALGDGEILLWKHELGDIFRRIPISGFTKPVVSPDGSLVVWNHDAKLVFWDIEKSEPKLAPEPLPGHFFYFTPDGRHLLSRVVGSDTIDITDAQTLMIRNSFDGAGRSHYQIAASPGSERVAIPDETAGGIRLHAAESGEFLLKLPQLSENQKIRKLGFSPGGRQLIGYTNDRELIIYSSLPWVEAVTAKPTVISSAGFEIDPKFLRRAYYGPPEYAIDDNPLTFWHTPWQSKPAPHPHELAIDLGSSRRFSQVYYLPRQDGETAGTVANYEIYASDNRSQWGAPIAEGSFPFDAKNPAAKQTIRLDNPVRARYLRFVALSAINNMQWTTVAELSVGTDGM
jgi:serine/threonine protein kinase/WD40 repeat protein